MVKDCSVCHVTKPIEDFYPIAAGKRMAKCKECWKQQVKVARQTNPRVREYDRERSKLPHRIENATRVTRDWRRRHPDRRRAHGAAARLSQTPPTRCEGCNQEKRVEKHHPDYSKPLLVVWLCKPCHAIADKIRRRLETA